MVLEKFNVKERCLFEDIDRRLYFYLLDIDVLDVKIKKVLVLIGKDVGEVYEVFEVWKLNRFGS